MEEGEERETGKANERTEELLEAGGVGDASGDVCEKTDGGSTGVCVRLQAGNRACLRDVASVNTWCRWREEGRLDGRRMEWLLETAVTVKPPCQTAASSLSHRHTHTVTASQEEKNVHSPDD